MHTCCSNCLFSDLNRFSVTPPIFEFSLLLGKKKKATSLTHYRRLKKCVQCRCPGFRALVITDINTIVFDLSWQVPTNRDETTWLASRLPHRPTIMQIILSSVKLCLSFSVVCVPATWHTSPFIKLHAVLAAHLITVEKCFTLPTYAQYLTIVSFHPYTCFGLLTAILRGPQH
jgi:hypothetical protein